MEVTKELLQSLFYYDAVNGKLYNRVDRNGNSKKWKEVGSLCNHGYKETRIKSKKFYLHRLIWIYNYDDIPKGKEIDHIDHDRSNNKLCNLRLVNSIENKKNMSLKSNNTSGYHGVGWDKNRNKWYARITIDYKNIYLGYFKNKSFAIMARFKAEKKFNFHANHGK